MVIKMLYDCADVQSTGHKSEPYAGLEPTSCARTACHLCAPLARRGGLASAFSVVQNRPVPAFSGAPDVFSCIGALSLQQLGGPVQLLDTLLQLTQLFGPLIHLLLEVLYRHRAPDFDLSHGAAADSGAGAAEEVAPDPQLSPAAVPPGQQVREGLFPLRRRAVVGAVDGGDQPLQLLVVRRQLPQQLPGEGVILL